jgi:3-deoxy-manno-octulosonate cytidylyltransferase (CMP-KDO synthetase)
MRTLIVIPARLGSWRFPDKPLVDILGMPMIEHVYLRSRFISGVNDIVVATCDYKIARAAEKFGVEVVMTSDKHRTAAERVAEAARIKGYVAEDDIVINVQGDEPVVPPRVPEITRDLLLNSNGASCANLVEKITDPSDLANPNRVKAILSINNYLIFLSRECVPSKVFDIEEKNQFLRLTCITAYRGPFLQYYCELQRTPVEIIEGNDLMRLIEHDIRVPSGVSPYETHPVDTPEDVPKVIEILKKDKLFQNGYVNLEK